MTFATFQTFRQSPTELSRKRSPPQPDRDHTMQWATYKEKVLLFLYFIKIKCRNVTRLPKLEGCLTQFLSIALLPSQKHSLPRDFVLLVHGIYWDAESETEISLSSNPESIFFGHNLSLPKASLHLKALLDFSDLKKLQYRRFSSMIIRLQTLAEQNLAESAVRFNGIFNTPINNHFARSLYLR